MGNGIPVAQRRVAILACVALALTGTIGWAVALTRALAPAAPTEAVPVVMVERSDLVPGTCIADSFDSGFSDVYFTFSLVADRYTAVPCAQEHRAEVLARVDLPAAESWLDYGLEGGPSAIEAQALVDGTCAAHERLLEGSRSSSVRASSKATQDQLVGAYVARFVAPMDDPLLGLCLLVGDRAFDRAWLPVFEAWFDEPTDDTVDSPEASVGTTPTAGTCLARNSGPDVAWDSAVPCDRPHRYVVLGSLPLPILALGDTTRDAAGYAALMDGVDDSAFDACAALLGDLVGFPSAVEPPVGVEAAAIRLQPAGPFFYDVTLPTVEAWLDPVHPATEALCSIAWTDATDQLRSLRLPEETDISMLYDGILPMSTTMCWGQGTRVTRYTSDRISCNEPHRYQLIATFDAAAFLTADELEQAIADRAISAPLAEASGLWGVCPQLWNWIGARAVAEMTSVIATIHEPAEWFEGYYPVHCAFGAEKETEDAITQRDWTGTMFDGHE